MKFRQHIEAERAGIQLAPMIDIVFLLLIFFIVTWSFARFEAELDISVPAAEEGGNPQRTVGEIIVNVRQDGRIIVNAASLTEEQLFTKLVTISEVNSDQAVILRGDEKTPYQHIVAVLDVCMKAKIWNVRFATATPEL